MKNFFFKILTLTIGFVISHSFHAQSCQTATHVCNGTSFTLSTNVGASLPSSLSVSNPTNDPFPPNFGCIKNGGSNPNWIIFTIASSGNLGFSMSDNSSPNPQSGYYDWIMWPYTPSTCPNIFNNILPPIACNFNNAPTGGTGMGTVPAGGDPGNYQPSIPVTAGQQFLLFISNYGNLNTLLTFSSTGSASLTCDQAFNPDIVTCSGQTVTYTANSFALTNTSFTLNPGNIIQSSPIFTLSISSTQVFTINCSGYGQNIVNPVSYTSSFTFSVHLPPPIIVNNPIYACDESVINFTIGPSGNYTTFIVGSNGYNSTFSSQQITINTLNLPKNDQYTLTTAYPTGCSNNTVTSINISTVTAVNVQVVPKVCEGEVFELNASVPTSANYFWHGPNTYASSLQNNQIFNCSVAQSGIYTVTATFAHSSAQCSKSNTVNVKIDECVYISEFQSKTINIWPNPAGDYLYYDGDYEEIAIILIDNFGRTVQIKALNGAVDISSVKDGLYTLLFFRNKVQIAQKKLVVIKP